MTDSKLGPLYAERATPISEIVSSADPRIKGGCGQKAAALSRYIERLSPNLLRAYVLDMIVDAPPQEIEKLVVAFKAQNDVPRGG